MYQTLEDFFQAPFGEPETKSNDFERKYISIKKNKKIHMEAYTVIDDNYLLHIKVGSESNSGQYYDVIFLFFTDDPSIKKEMSLRNYYVKFFSNSPSFIYQYAVLYKENGVLIDMLYDKLDPEYSDKRPEKTNPGNKLSYDKSIYCACRFMQDQKISAFSKVGILARKKKSPESFFKDIGSFKDVKLGTEIRQLDKKIDKELESAKTNKSKKSKNKLTSTGTVKPKTNTFSKTSNIKPVKVVKRGSNIKKKTRASTKTKNIGR